MPMAVVSKAVPVTALFWVILPALIWVIFPLWLPVWFGLNLTYMTVLFIFPPTGKRLIVCEN